MSVLILTCCSALSPQQLCNGLSFNDLPLHMQNKILCNLSDAYDIINVGQTTPTLQILSEDRMLWKKLCHFHFSDKQVGEQQRCKKNTHSLLK